MSARDSWLRFAPQAPALEDGQKWHVFLSYRSVNRPWTINLYDVLREHGFEVFIDQCSLKPGDELIASLEDALESSRSGVLIWSSDAANSRWCRREYHTMESRADDGGFHFVPVRLDGEQLPRFARNRVFLDFQEYPEGPGGGELLRLLHAVVGRALSPEAARFAVEQDGEARKAARAVRAAVSNGDAEHLVELAKRDDLAWTTTSALGCKAAEGLTKLKRYDEALHVLEPLCKAFPRAVRPRQLRALALARRGGDGDLRDAQRILGELYEEGERDPETLGIYGRTWMDRYAASKNKAHLEESRDCYRAAFERSPDDYYTGVNAAAKSVFLGSEESLGIAADLASRVQDVVGKDPVEGDYWRSATVAEVFLMTRDFENAGRVYRASVAMAPEEIGSHESTWLQAQRLMEMLHPTPEQRRAVSEAFSHL